MEPIQSASVTKQCDGYTDEKMLFTYDEEEMERNEVNASNAERVFSPEFIPDYVSIEKKLGLSMIETRIYGFVRFYMHSANTKGRFYFTDRQLAEVTNVSEKSVSRSIKRLRELGLIKTSHKMKAGGGILRFILRVNGGSSEQSSRGIRNSQVDCVIDNKIKENSTKHIRGASPTARSTTTSSKRATADFVRTFNETLGTKYKAIPTVESHMRKALTQYSYEEIVQAFRNASKDGFLLGDNKDGKTYLTPEYITRVEKIDQWLNSKKKGTSEKDKLIWK